MSSPGEYLYYYDELASLFAQPTSDTMQQRQEASCFPDFLLAGPPTATRFQQLQSPTSDVMQHLLAGMPMGDYDPLFGALDLPVAAADDVVKRELVVDTTSGGGSRTPSTAPVTPNATSSMSSSSSEAAGGGRGGFGAGGFGAAKEDSPAGRCKKEEGDGEDSNVAGKGDQEDGDKCKRGAGSAAKAKGKGGEKRQQQPRFAFMTKSEVDHLEDGYRWRKYGQKAVKNSPYPRSYHRCATQRCPVKKRVERSYLDPAVVITTYEGKHTHPIPAALRGSTHLLAAQAAHGLHHHQFGSLAPMPHTMGAAAPFGRTGGGGGIDMLGLLQPRSASHRAMLPTTMAHASSHGLAAGPVSSSVAMSAATTTTSSAPSPSSLQMQHMMAQDFGFLQDMMMPSFVHSNVQP